MIYFCADDYGASVSGNLRIEECIEKGVINKVSVLPNGETTDFKERLTRLNVLPTLHLNLVEGRPLSNRQDIELLTTNDGCFKRSFVGLFFLSYSSKRKELEKQVYNEIKCQIDFWKKNMGDDVALSIDGHQHTHMIPLIFRTMMKVIKEEGITLHSIRIPADPLLPYLFTPQMYFKYPPISIVKQCLLNTLAFINRNQLKKAGVKPAYFVSKIFSGKLDAELLSRIIKRYIKRSNKSGRDIEIGFHPGYLTEGEDMMDGTRKDFKEFYFSPDRRIEYDTLINLKNYMKEGQTNALY